jgi:hypothetical protein
MMIGFRSSVLIVVVVVVDIVEDIGGWNVVPSSIIFVEGCDDRSTVVERFLVTTFRFFVFFFGTSFLVRCC